jgi:hypothetical protein
MVLFIGVEIWLLFGREGEFRPRVAGMTQDNAGGEQSRRGVARDYTPTRLLSDLTVAIRDSIAEMMIGTRTESVGIGKNWNPE